MAYTQDFFEFVNEQLSEFGAYDTRKMFGGVGYYKEGVMFALLGNDQFCLKADETSIPTFENYGMKAFMSSDKHKGLPYWQVPVEVLEDKQELTRWAQKAYAIAIKTKTKK